jgi:uncharacterized FAD-dependent dehydrogenase
LAQALRVSEKTLSDLHIVRKSLDARARNRPVWRYALEFTCAQEPRHPKVSRLPATPPSPSEIPAVRLPGSQVAVVGSGPAGMAAALFLARKGYAVTVFEQGRPVGPRFRDIRLFIKQNRFDARSNILFGEGGAGTFSDGKLTARTRNAHTEALLRELVACGADPSILYLHHPHLGTDRLQFIIAAFRRRCEEAGAVFRFDTEVTDLLVEQGNCRGVVAEGKELPYDSVVLAPGLSAHGLYQALSARGVAMERKGFSVGVRVEHPQDLVNRCQLGEAVDARLTGAAEYFLTHGSGGSGVYSFCMCPGGVVIPCADRPDALFTNGMSYSNRATPFANSAVVATVDVAALPGGVLAGVEYQLQLEKAAFRMGGGGFSFPAQTAPAFLEGRRDDGPPPRTSFLKPLRWSDFRELFQAPVAEALAAAFRAFDRRMPGFTAQGLLIGPESRTSSPVRILRDPGTLQSVNTAGLYPIGEGAGFAGGIVSSGADGIRLAESVAPWPARSA